MWSCPSIALDGRSPGGTSTNSALSETVARILRRLGRVAEPLLHPDADDRRRREAAAAKRVESLNAAVTRAAEQLDRVGERVDKLDRRHVKHLRHAIAALEWSTRRQVAFADKLLESSLHHEGHEFVRERVLRRIRHVAQREGPILVGPWTGEVGFELLYWAPFVRWVVERFRIDPARVTLLSRGGTASWYGVAGARYLDALELCSANEFRERTLKERKQRTLRLFDRQLMRRALHRLERRPSVLHPAMMYALLAPYWDQRTSLQWVHQCARFTRIGPPAIQNLRLPREYVAVRFYFSKCFPETPENQALVNALVQSLATDIDVVLLGSGASLDEHRDVTPGPKGAAQRAGGSPSDRIHNVDHVMQPATNLAVQTAVIAGAKAFIGTYGGFSYLAPLCGVDTVALYSRRNFYPHHLYLAQQAFDAVEGGSLTVMDAATWPLARYLAAAASQPVPHR